MASGDSEKPEIIKKNYEELGLDCLVCIGGNGTQKTANLLSQIGLNVIGVPKTIDNDIWGTDITFGFNTAVNIATESIDRLHSTASSHKRVMVVEVMGHHAGWIALYAGMAGGADVILLPELGYDIDKVNEAILDRARRGKPYSIVVVAEGIETPDKSVLLIILPGLSRRERVSRPGIPYWDTPNGVETPLRSTVTLRLAWEAMPRN